MLRSLQSALQGGSIMGSRIRARVLKTACKASGCRPPIHPTSQNHGLSIRTENLHKLVLTPRQDPLLAALRAINRGCVGFIGHRFLDEFMREIAPLGTRNV